MKKLILSTLALAALTFSSCKKDNLQPTVNSTTNIETSNDDDKADARNKFVGTWKGTSFGPTSTYGTSVAGEKFTYVITKNGSNKLKIITKIVTSDGLTFQGISYGKVVAGQIKSSWSGVTEQVCGITYREIKGYKHYSNSSKKMVMVFEELTCGDLYKAATTVTKQ